MHELQLHAIHFQYLQFQQNNKNNQRNLYRQSILREAWNEFLPSAPDGYQEFEEAWTKYREQALAKVNLITLGQGL